MTIEARLRGLFRSSVGGILALFAIASMLSCVPTNPKPPADPAHRELLAVAQKAAEHGTKFTAAEIRAQAPLTRDWTDDKVFAEYYPLYFAELDRTDLVKQYSLPITVMSLLAVIFVLLREKISGWMKGILDRLERLIVRRLGSHRALLEFRLRPYRRSLSSKYSQLKLPFQHDAALQMEEVFIPLKVAGTLDAVQISARDALAGKRVAVVTGPPGSGKSMLLRKIALDFGLGFDTYYGPKKIPILLELFRLGGSSKSLVEQIVEELHERNDFPCAREFVEDGLSNGNFVLLLDGLDEVASASDPMTLGCRQWVARQIHDLLEKHERCSAVITCRNAVYKGELRSISNTELTLVEFSDQQIRRFLGMWWRADEKAATRTGGQKSIDHLISTLDARPNIKALARNPLILTFIVYLYTHTPLVLPHSRSDFYKQMCDVLLGADVYKAIGEGRSLATEKRRLLNHLAYQHLKAPVEDASDHRSMSRDFVLNEIAALLPTLRRDAKDAQDVLHEIVERSGLLIKIDNGERFQFPHLTLQEFFAAEFLHARSDELLGLFTTDPDTWRETLKLWCGLSADATALIQSVESVDRLTALECLAEAAAVQADVADKIIARVEIEFAQASDREIKAIATLAAAPHRYGSRIFQFLEVRLGADQQSEHAASALAATNLPTAAQAIDRCLPDPRLENVLIQMGDLAVDPLLVRAASGEVEAVGRLETIGTPRAGVALANLLGVEDVEVPAAWAVARLIRDEAVFSAIVEAQVAVPPAAKKINWVWEPFSTSLVDRAFFGRVAHLISGAISLEPYEAIDPRLGVPIVAITQGSSVEEKLAFFKVERDDVKRFEFTIRDWQEVFSDARISKLHSVSASTLLVCLQFANIALSVTYAVKLGWNIHLLWLSVPLFSVLFWTWLLGVKMLEWEMPPLHIASFVVAPIPFTKYWRKQGFPEGDDFVAVMCFVVALWTLPIVATIGLVETSRSHSWVAIAYCALLVISYVLVDRVVRLVEHLENPLRLILSRLGAPLDRRPVQERRKWLFRS